jgi:hypothetical protein
MAQLYSNNRGLAQSYPEENIISQLAENKSASASPAFCLSYVQIDLDLLEAVQEITQHVHFPVRVLPSRRCVPHFSFAKTAILKCLGLLPGPKHNGDLGTKISEYPIHLFFQGEYVPRHRARRRVSYWTSRVLVHTALLEDKLKEDGKTIK